MRENDDIVQQLRDTRIRLGLSYEKLGALAGYSPQAIWWLERRSVKPRIQTMLDLAQAMGIAIDRNMDND